MYTMHSFKVCGLRNCHVPVAIIKHALRIPGVQANHSLAPISDNRDQAESPR